MDKERQNPGEHPGVNDSVVFVTYPDAEAAQCATNDFWEIHATARNVEAKSLNFYL